MPVSYQIYPLSERAITIEFSREINLRTHQLIIQADTLLKSSPFTGWIENVPAYTSLTVYYDPLLIRESDKAGGNNTSYQLVSQLAQQVLQRLDIKERPLQSETVIPVCYENEFAYDIDFVASYHQLSVEDVVQLHTKSSYTVYMMGFAPGFPYMGLLPDQLDTPRKASPRTQLTAGSVGIAGKQTGIYPFDTPGGWQIIGRTPLKLFDTDRASPTLLQTGNQVRFQRIDKETFYRLLQS